MQTDCTKEGIDMSIFSTTFGWARALALGGALLVGAVAVAGPAAASGGFQPDVACLEASNISLAEADDANATLGFSDFADSLSIVSITDADDAYATLGATAVIDQAESIGFTQVDEQADAAQINCSR
jgi:hypothetical protein